MNIPLFFFLILTLAILCVFIGKKSAKGLQTQEDYFLMGRKLSLVPLALTLLATQLGGGTLLGAAEEAYKSGFSVLFYPLGASLGLLILGLGFGKKFRNLNISTIAEIFEKVYRSRKQRSIASILSILTMFLILVAQCIAARKFFVSIGINSPLFFTFSWAAVVIYTVLGGLKAVVKTDILQAILILLVLGSAYFFIDSKNLSTISISQASLSIKNVSWTGWFLMPLLFMLIEQDMGQRCFAAKSSKIIPSSTIIAAALLFTGSAIAIMFGVLAKSSGLNISDDSCTLLESVKFLTNSKITTFFMVAIFLAIISTADSLLCSISSNISCDFFPTKKLYLSRALTALTGFGALGLSYLFSSVVNVLMISYELSVCILCVPVISAIYLKKPTKTAAYFSMTFGALSFLTLRIYEIPFPKEIVSLTLSLSGYVLGQFIQKQRRIKLIQR